MSHQDVNVPKGLQIPSSVWTYKQTYSPEDRPKGTYCSNNDVLAIVDGNGSMYVTPFSSERAQALEDAGFKSASWWVPYSNGDMPKDMVDWFDSTRRLDDEKRAESTPVPRIAGAEMMTNNAKRVGSYRVLTYSVIGKDGKAILGSPRPEDEPQSICYVTLNQQDRNGPSKYEYNLYHAPYTDEAAKELEAAGFRRSSWHPGTVSISEGTRRWTAQLFSQGSYEQMFSASDRV